MSDDDKTKGDMVRIACGVPGGLEIRKYEKTRGEFGQDVITAVGEPVKLEGPPRDLQVGGARRFGYTDVDKGWWAAWAAQNKLHPALAEGDVFEEKPDEHTGGDVR